MPAAGEDFGYLECVGSKPALLDGVPIVPDKPKESEVMRRLLTEDEDDRMPPTEIHKPLTVEQKELFRLTRARR